MAPVIEIEGLRKEYRRLRRPSTVALDGLDLEVTEGGVFGFLGPNGAGKTTTIRCLLGLVAASAGRARLLGNDVPRGLPGVIRRVGSIVEAPMLFPRFTGRRNLQILARIDGIASDAVDAALDRVGLTARANDMVRTYSLGMKQRLGIAAALLKDPSLLILDEPANGLDPAGIVEVRDLLRSLGAEGRTVFVSSHILSEVQQVADRVAILARGRLVAAGSVHDVLASGRGARIAVRVPDLEAGRLALADAGIAATIEGDLLRAAVPPEDGERVARALAAKEIYPSLLQPDEGNLEQAFLELTGDDRPGGRMTRLLASELLRFRSRRLVVVMLVGVLLATTIGLVIAAWQSTPPTESVVAAARAQARDEVAHCLESDFEGGELPGSPEEFCRENFGNPAHYMPSHVALVDLPQILEGISSITSILGLVIGASSVAASWQTGTISTILSWEPRRLRWLAARILVLAAGVLVMTALIVMFLSAGLALAATLRGSTVGVDGAWWTDALMTSLRVSVAAAISAVIGGAVAAVGRHTAAALGVVFVWTAVSRRPRARVAPSSGRRGSSATTWSRS